MISIKNKSILDKPELPQLFIEGWYFTDDEDGKWWKHPWRAFTHKDFRHCSIVIKHNLLNLHTLIDPSMAATQVHPILVETIEDDIIGAIKHTHCLYFRIPITEKVLIRGIGSCVGTLKQILGITDYTVVTPKGLYNLLLTKYNAKEIL